MTAELGACAQSSYCQPRPAPPAGFVGRAIAEVFARGANLLHDEAMRQAGGIDTVMINPALTDATSPDSHVALIATRCRRQKSFLRKTDGVCGTGGCGLATPAAARRSPCKLALIRVVEAVVIATSPDSHVALIAARCRRQKSFLRKTGGDCGTGDCGTGDCGTGDCGTGDCGTGDCGTGVCGTGGCGLAMSAAARRSPCKLALIGALIHLLTRSKRL